MLGCYSLWVFFLKSREIGSNVYRFVAVVSPEDICRDVTRRHLKVVFAEAGAIQGRVNSQSEDRFLVGVRVV